MPPARGFAPAANKSSASSSVFGAVYSNFCGIISVSPCNQLPDLFRRQRHVNVSNSQRRERIHHRVDYGGGTTPPPPPPPPPRPPHPNPPRGGRRVGSLIRAPRGGGG